MQIIFILIFSIIINSCTVTSEKYRYNWRISKFLNLLTEEEREAFKNNELSKLGVSLDYRISNDTDLSNKIRKIQEYEAITAFNGTQMAYFYRYTLLKELNRDNFYKFMDLLTADEQVEFAKNTNFDLISGEKYDKDNKFKNFVDYLRDNYNLKNYNFKQLYKFFREVSFPEVSRRELYYLLKVLSETKALDDFKKGEINSASQILDLSLQKSISIKYEFNRIKKSSSLSKLNTYQILDVYYNVIMKEMHPNALRKTLEKF